MYAKRKNGSNTCLTDSVAYISNIPSKEVPFFIARKKWFKSLCRWSNLHGHIVKWVDYNTSRARKLEKTKKLYIAIGQSPSSKVKKPSDRRGSKHAIVMRGKKCVYDNTRGRGCHIKGAPLFYIEFIKPRQK